MVGQLLHRCELHALSPVADQLLARPSGRFNALLEVGEISVARMILEWADRGIARRLRGGADD
jgi:hypothetical protein